MEGRRASPAEADGLSRCWIMTVSSRRAVLTGVGVITSVGADCHSFWRSLVEGRTGIKAIKSFDASGLPVRIAAEIPDFDAKDYVEKSQRKSLRVMARTIQLAVSAAQLALNDSSVDKSKLDPTRFGVAFGCSLIASELLELADAATVSTNCQPGAVDLDKWGKQGLEAMNPLWLLKYLPNMPASHVSMLHDAQGPNNSITENDVAGLLALGEAYRIVKRDQADFFLVGGAESRINPLTLTRMCLFEPLSRRNDAPEKACRPFDRNRDGLVLGEGAGVFVLEELEHARKRGARILAEVVGFGSAFDHKKDGSGLARAVRAALRDAGVGPDEIDHVNAHGLGTTDADVLEARGLSEAFGASKEPAPVCAVKSYLGNLGAAGASTELIASVLALRHGLVPPTLNYEDPDPECPIPVIAGAPRPVTQSHVLKVSFTRLGQCAALVLRKM
jgi:3-oxoacyl-[acyl-carrier-protein] synthase II